jgi:hypothetical protein
MRSTDFFQAHPVFSRMAYVEARALRGRAPPTSLITNKARFAQCDRGHASCSARQRIDGLTLPKTRRPRRTARGRREVFDVKSIG